MYRCALILLALLPLTVLAGQGYRPIADPSADDIFVFGSELVRLSRERAAIVWRSLPDVQTFEPAISDDLVLAGSSRGLYALDRASGAVRWRIKAGSILYSPAVTREYAYVAGQDGSLRAVALSDGRTRWQRHFAGWLYPPAVADGLLVTGGSARTLFGIDRGNGKTRWTIDLGNEPVYRSVAVDQGRVVVTVFDGSVLMLDAQTGDTLWRVEDQAASRPPGVAAGRLYLAGLDGVLRVRTAATGKLIWSRRLQSPLSEPIISGGVVVVTAADRIIALHALYGGVLWERSAPFILAGRPRISGDKLILVSRDYRLAAWRLRGIPKLSH